MTPADTSSDLLLLGSAILTSFVSAIIPLVNMEVYVVFLGSVATPRILPVALILATLSHMAGKAVIYYASREFERLPDGRFKERMRAVRNQAERHSRLGAALVFTSSLVGLPPFYLITVVCGAIRFHFLYFFLAGFAGRLIRFAALIMLPQLAWNPR